MILSRAEQRRWTVVAIVVSLGVAVARDAAACPCSARAPGEPRMTAPEDDEEAPVDAHVWLWFPRELRGGLGLRTLFATIDGAERHIALSRRDTELHAETLVELAPPGRWPANTLVDVWQRLERSQDGGERPAMRVLSFRTSTENAKRPSWSGTSDAQIDPESDEWSPCGREGMHANAVLDDPRDADARPLLFVWSTRGDASPGASTPPEAVLRLDDAVFSLQRGDGCGAANFSFGGDAFVTAAVNLAGRRSVARRARVIGAPPSERPDVPVVAPVPSLEDTAIAEPRVAASPERRRPSPWLVVLAACVTLACGAFAIVRPRRGRIR